jgi:hypothetical protein
MTGAEATVSADIVPDPDPISPVELTPVCTAVLVIACTQSVSVALLKHAAVSLLGFAIRFIVAGFTPAEKFTLIRFDAVEVSAVTVKYPSLDVLTSTPGRFRRRRGG